MFNPIKKHQHGALDPFEGKSQQEILKQLAQTMKDLGPSATELVMQELGVVDVSPGPGVAGDGEEGRESQDPAPRALPTLQ